MQKVDKTSPVPLYYQLKNILVELIENEELQPDDPIPPERELCEYHGVSRMTVNKAVVSLVNQGVLYREQGKGTFVAPHKGKYTLSGLFGFTEDMERRGLTVRTTLISFEKKEATKKILETLKLEDHQPVFEITRLRYVEEEPYALETAYIPVYLCETLTADMLQDHSLYGLLTGEFGLQIEHAYQTIEPVLMNDYESNMLDVKKNKLALLFSRRTYVKGNIPMEMTKAIYRSDRYKFEVTLQR
ncbi:GntR family transcriptional regulator [Propionispora hippei]|uniref:GntR family transcriptional regulator n=1 Tax=Propionispora hippei DSM 15287 TaxID=1123003 RepID=A0A1M6CSM2_9FIRM|nr:GntR family transcriptional regulator [Propionispora hippei]SHI63863.1 GntR family transcriptional regulator [Propionispora hippei DSM 15287]